MTATIRQLMNGKYCVDDGEGPLLDMCPCCGLGLTKPAAELIVEKIERNELTLNVLREACELRRRINAMAS